MFDLRNDPNQYTNLAENTECAGVVEAFKGKLAAKLRELGDNDLEIT